MLELREVSKSYGKKEAVHKFSAIFNPGIYGLLGPNGAGKSTLMNMIADITKVTRGEILYNGANIHKLDDKYREKLGYLPQSVGYYGNFTAKMMLDYFAVLRGVPKKDRKNRIEEVLSLVNLSEATNNKISSFSGGMKQRLGIAVALVGNPELIILDEPTVGLDPKERLRFRNILSKISKEKIIILSTHIVSDIDTIAQNVILLKNGQVIAKDTCENIIKLVDGKIWSASVKEEELISLQNKYRVTNIERTLDGCLDIVLLSDSKPEIKCENKKAILEDVYMYFYDELVK